MTVRSERTIGLGISGLWISEENHVLNSLLWVQSELSQNTTSPPPDCLDLSKNNKDDQINL